MAVILLILALNEAITVTASTFSAGIVNIAALMEDMKIIISGLNTSPPCIILLSKFNRKVRISHHD